MTADEQKELRSRNLRVAFIVGSIAASGFLGIILRSWFMMQQ